MARQIEQPPFESNGSQPLIGIPFDEGCREVVRYFADEQAADEAVAEYRKRGGRDIRQLAGVWRDLDWEQAADELERIRHASKTMIRRA